MITYAVKHGGRWRVLDVSPGTMVRFEDEFGQSMPDGTDGGHMWRHIAWLAHQSLDRDVPFDQWLADLEDLTGDDARLAEIRAELQGKVVDEPAAEAEPDPTPLRAASGATG